MASGQTWKTSSMDRTLVAMGLAGSAAALDSKCDVFIGEVKVGELYNTSLAAVQKDTDMFRGGAFIPAGAPVTVTVVDAPATNPLNLALDFS